MSAETALPPAGVDRLTYEVDEADQLSVALLLDRSRELLVEAWDAGREPTHLVVPQPLFRLLQEAKAPEARTGMQLSIFGLLVLASDR